MTITISPEAEKRLREKAQALGVAQTSCRRMRLAAPGRVCFMEQVR